MHLGYIDPGAGTIILQSLIAAVLGVAIFFRNAVKRVFLTLFMRRRSSEDKSDDASDT